MRPGGFHLATILIVLVLGGCSRGGNVTTAPAASAYTDGFEVIVVEMSDDGTVAAVRALPLADAEAEIAGNAACTMLLPGDPGRIAERLERHEDVAGDFNVGVTVVAGADEAQEVHVIYQYSARTFTYTYRVQGTTVTPLRSSCRDLGRSNEVQYVVAED